MPDDRISLRQLLALLFAALLAPAIGVLPSQTAALAGEAGWLSALAALPVLLGLCWVLFALLRPAGEGAGLAQVCLLYTSPSPRDGATSRMPSSA